MSISSLGGQFGVGPQTAKGSAASIFYRFRATRIQGGLVTETEPMPPEISGVPLPDGAHSLGAYYATQVELIPRLESDLGWLLYAVCGDVSTIADSPEAGLNTHVFRMSTSDYLALNWLTARRVTPGPAGGADSGEQALDTRASGLVLNFAGAQRLTAQLSLYGRKPSFSDNVSGWSWADEAEGGDSIGIVSSTSAHFQIPRNTALPVNAATVTLGNQVTQPRVEYIIGSPHPDDITPLYRNLQIEAAYKWEDEDLYLQLVANGGTGASIDWSPSIYTSTFSVKSVSPNNIDGYSNPYSIEVRAEKVYWAPSGAPEVAGMQLIRLPITGFVARPDSGDPFQIRLVNETASYTWPT